jgi:hypothetical protein
MEALHGLQESSRLRDCNELGILIPSARSTVPASESSAFRGKRRFAVVKPDQLMQLRGVEDSTEQVEIRGGLS